MMGISQFLKCPGWAAPALIFAALGCQRQEPLPVAGPPASALSVSAAATLGPGASANQGLALPGVADSSALTPVPAVPAVDAPLSREIAALHAALGPGAAELRPAVLAQACVGYLALRQLGRARPGAVLAVADLDLPNTTPRLWVIDLKRRTILHRSLVAHGRGSGGVRARRFSGKIKSACSALGFYRTAGTYEGKHGLSRRLQGLDPGQNSTAEDRYVVLHGASYVSPAYVAAYGELGYSRGCPALPPTQYVAIIRALPAGHVLLLSGPGLASRWLAGPAAGRRFAAQGWD